ncbi:MAG: hypothetical protein Q4E36_00180 [Bacillota bacterium]|nr:hypothetical protein [Bacillota bacterium]
MKKFILIVFVLGLLASVGTAISVAVFEDQPLKEVVVTDAMHFFNDDEDSNLDQDEIFSGENIFSEDDLLEGKVFEDAIEIIEISNLNGSLLMEKGDKEAVEIYNPKNRDLAFVFEEGYLFLDERGPGENSGEAKGNDDVHIKITSKNPENINFSISNINGKAEIKNQLEFLYVKNINGLLKIKADKSFDLSIDNVNGSSKVRMKDLSAFIKIDMVNGLCKINGQDETDIAILKPIEKTLGDGENQIKIGTVNGYVEIND